MGGTISDIVKVVDDAVKQVILQIDPSIVKVKNSTLTLLDSVEAKIQSNGHHILSSLRGNLLIWLFLTVIFSLLVLAVLRSLIDLLQKLQFTLITRQFMCLLAITIVILWILLASIFGVFSPYNIDWTTLKMIVFTFVCICTLILIFIWFRFAKIYRRHVRGTLRKLLSSSKEKIDRLQQSTMTLHMLAIKKSTTNDPDQHV